MEKHGYGNMTNLIRLKRVWMTTHKEGTGTDKDPLREVHTFFSEDGDFLARKDGYRDSITHP